MKNKLEWTHNPIPTIISHLSVYQITGVRTPTELRRDVFLGFLQSKEPSLFFVFWLSQGKAAGKWRLELLEGLQCYVYKGNILYILLKERMWVSQIWCEYWNGVEGHTCTGHFYRGQCFVRWVEMGFWTSLHGMWSLSVDIRKWNRVLAIPLSLKPFVNKIIKKYKNKLKKFGLRID